MPTIAQQLRSERRRRVRRHRAAVGGVLAVAAIVLVPQIVSGAGGDGTGAWPELGPTSTPSTTAAPTTTTTTPRGLHPGLVAAFERAQAEAARAGHDLTITSGFRTAAEQAALLEDEIAERGSREEALWWVFPPDESMHVQGLAIDVGDGPAADWLIDEGPRFGLCHTLAWEWWHFEWRQRWEDRHACPPVARDPSQAPSA